MKTVGPLLRAFLWLLSFTSTTTAASKSSRRVLGPQAINLWKLDKTHSPWDHGGSMFAKDDQAFIVQDNSQAGMALPRPKFRAWWFEQPLDHFDERNRHTFQQRYWVNDRHYQPGSTAPVIVIDGGETSGEDRLPFLDTGIAEILAKATGGIGVVLEHRYYGESIPVNNFSTDSLRWLTNEQSAADSARFMANVKFDGIGEDLTAPGTPWIYYGGSYAGARAAHMRILYPDLVYGAIASSAVTHAALSNWEYMEVIRKAADPKCSSHLQNSIIAVDALLNIPAIGKQLKAFFGLRELKHDDDFVALLESPLGTWQEKVWDPEFSSDTFDEFCASLDKPLVKHSVGSLTDLPFDHPSRMVRISHNLSLDYSIINYAKWIKENVVSKCPKDQTHEQCFGTYDDSKYQSTSLDEDWRLWLFQVCTQWGYFTTAPPNSKQPRIISRRITLDYESKICKQAFPPGEHFSIPNMPNITSVNALGDFELAADRLAFIDGEIDPWRPDTPHSEYALQRNDTILRPFKLIPGAVHHWDEWGLKNMREEPVEIREIHEEMIEFVKAWLKDWEN